MTDGSATRRIKGQFHTKIWGSHRLEPWFEPPGDEKIGEVWFPADDLLIKFLFTSEKLSVQVHPDDAYARRHENSLGKTEMWHILRADPGAQIALGFKQPMAPEDLIPAAESGSIMDMLNWIDVHPGETYFVPPGTVHAIGGGLALCEIQQYSDVTYRLFDYGRGRDLHLRQAEEVSRLDCLPDRVLPLPEREGVQLLVECPYFRTYRAVVERPQVLGQEREAGEGTRFLVVLAGSGSVNGLPASAGGVFACDGSEGWMLEPEAPGRPGRMTLLLIA